jgi:hypothetical protein
MVRGADAPVHIVQLTEEPVGLRDRLKEFLVATRRKSRAAWAR